MGSVDWCEVFKCFEEYRFICTAHYIRNHITMGTIETEHLFQQWMSLSIMEMGVIDLGLLVERRFNEVFCGMSPYLTATFNVASLCVCRYVQRCMGGFTILAYIISL